MDGYETVDGFQYGAPMPPKTVHEHQLSTIRGHDKHGFNGFPLLASKFIVGGTNQTTLQARNRNPDSVFDYRHTTENGRRGVRIWRIK